MGDAHEWMLDRLGGGQLNCPAARQEGDEKYAASPVHMWTSNQKDIIGAKMTLKAFKMKKIIIALTMEELQALVTMSTNQFFRQKFIDPKMPGHKARPNELRAAQSAVHVLQEALRKEKGFTETPAKT